MNQINWTFLGILGFVWGVGGITLSIALTVYRLSKYVSELSDFSLSGFQIGLIVVWVVGMIWGEGYRGFHKAFSPRVAARARYLVQHPKPLHVLLAPLFCFGFFFADPVTKRKAFTLTIAIALLVLIVRQLPQPWRGIVDTGVVAGLSFGVLTLIWWGAHVLTGKPIEMSAGLPESARG